MTTQASNQKQLPADKFNEIILVVKRSNLMPDGNWTGLQPVDFQAYLELIEKHKEFIKRGLAETDPSYKQIIPYLIFRHDNLYFLMQRKGSSSEQRLANKFSLGIGGHLREEDINGTDIFEWAKREFHEEIAYSGSFSITPLGVLNREDTPVDQVHIGLVLLLEGNSPDIAIKSELQSGQLVPLSECKEQNLENWSRMVVDYLEASRI